MTREGFTWRTEPCDECDDGRVYDYGYGFTARTCAVCNGDAEVDACCVECGRLDAVNDAGECARCHDRHELNIAEYNARYPVALTEPVKGDPFKRRFAA